ncbi:hypothetical protein EI555_004064, partial [Monodon monoceros]
HFESCEAVNSVYFQAVFQKYILNSLETANGMPKFSKFFLDSYIWKSTNEMRLAKRPVLAHLQGRIHLEKVSLWDCFILFTKEKELEAQNILMRCTHNCDTLTILMSPLSGKTKWHL